MADSAYNESAYQRYRAWLLANQIACGKCGKRATSPDHNPPLSAHQHVRVGVCCVLQPACGECQCRQGAAIRNARSGSGYSWP